MNKFLIPIVVSLLLNTLQSSDKIFTSPKIALKMIDKKTISFISLGTSSLKIKKSIELNLKALASSDILGREGCSAFYVCSDKVEKYFSGFGIGTTDSLVIYDNSYGIEASTLYVILESIGHKNISILRGGLIDIAQLDPNWKIYTNYLDTLKNEDLNQSKNKIRQKINILKPHLLLQDINDTNVENIDSNYRITDTNSDYLLSKKELKRVVKRVRSKESNISIIDACEMIDIVGNNNGSYLPGVKSLSWKDLIDKKKKHLKSNDILEQLFKSLELNKNASNYVYCMAGAEKAFYVMMVLRELGYDKVKAFTGDWNSWVGDISE